MQDVLYKLDKTDKDIDFLLNKHKRLVYYMLTTYGQLQNQCAESAAWEALWDAINLFDPFASTAFSTFACTCIGNAIKVVLIKQKRQSDHQVVILEHIIERYTDFELTKEDDDRLYKLFENYVSTKTGTVRDVMVAWEASDYEMSGDNIAKLCGTSGSYVSRIQRDFRAYLGLHL